MKKIVDDVKKSYISKTAIATLLTVGEVANQIVSKFIGIDSETVVGKVKSSLANPESKPEEEIIIKEPTLVFIDNLERIGKDSSEILKLVYKLRKMENLFFILISNVEKMSNFLLNSFDSTTDKEYPIYKFVNTKIFDFSQNYIPFLRENIKETDEEELVYLNNELNKGENGEQLSIREFIHWTKDKKYFSAETKLDRLLLLKSIPYININEALILNYSNNIEEHLNVFKKAKNNLSVVLTNVISKKQIIF